MLETIAFYVLAGVAILTSALVIGQRNPVYSVLLLIGSFVALAGLYVQLDSPFLAVIQLIVYAGAIMVLFLFVIMLLNAGAEASPGRSWMAPLVGLPALAAFLALIAYLIQRSLPDTPHVRFGEFQLGGPRAIGEVLFTKYVLPFEATSVLILIAIIGAVVLAKKELD